MKIPWKFKSAIFGFIDVFKARKFLYFMQKNLTGRSRVDDLVVSEKWLKHKRTLQSLGATRSIFEFGAGKSLAQNLFLSPIVEQQFVVDLNPMLDLKLADAAREKLWKQTQLKDDTEIKSCSDLLRYGITYKAPVDASQTALPDAKFDACISTDTLEHIPKEDIITIFKEIKRILKRDGIVSAVIDYSDHYAHTDQGISLLNFLKYDDKSWNKYNHSSHYQNRLRHRDYVNIFRELGFEVLEESLDFNATNIPKEIFALFPGSDRSWMATSAHIVLKNNTTREN